jgi:PIN domain nuclease of toxin-antitoxin system
MLLLDTCALLWLVGQQESLSKQARNLIAKHSDALFISVISAFEIGVKQQKGLLILPLPADLWMEKVCEAHGIMPLSIDLNIAVQATQLPLIHRDPADRIIVSTAITHHLTVLTPDQHIMAYSQIKTAW